MKKIYCLLLCIIPCITQAQSVGISNSAITSDASSILELKSTKQGLLIPRMLSTERTAISNPATGLMIYQTDAPAGFYYFDGAAWKQVGASQSISPVNFRYSNDASQNVNASTDTQLDFKTLSFSANATFSNSTFTATSAGIYKFDSYLDIYSLKSGYMNIILELNGHTYTVVYANLTASVNQSATLSEYINMAAGDKVYVHVYSSVSAYISFGSSFSGFKIN